MLQGRSGRAVLRDVRGSARVDVLGGGYVELEERLVTWAEQALEEDIGIQRLHAVEQLRHDVVDGDDDAIAPLDAAGPRLREGLDEPCERLAGDAHRCRDAAQRDLTRALVFAGRDGGEGLLERDSTLHVRRPSTTTTAGLFGGRASLPLRPCASSKKLACV